MIASLGSLVVSLGLDAAEYTAGLDRAQRDAQRKSDDIQRTLARASTAVAAAAAGAVVGVLALTRSNIDAADSLLDLSKQANVTVETLGGIGFAASQAGSDLEGVSGSIGKLNLKIAAAARGDKDAVAAFNALGVSFKDLDGNARTADKVLVDLAEKFSTYENGPEKSALANELFGKSYASILPLLNDGGRALQENIDYYQRFGGVTTQTASQADQFNDTIGKLTLVQGQLGRSLAAELLPTLQAVADEVLRTAENSTVLQSAASGIKVVFDTITILGANVVFVLVSVGREIGAIAAQAAALARLDIKGFNAISEAVRNDGERARAELDAFERRVLLSNVLTGKRLDASTDPRSLTFGQPLPTVPGTRAPSLGDGSGGGGGRGRSQASEATSEAQRYLDTLSRQVERTQELSAVETALAEIRRGMKGLNAQIAGDILDKAMQIDASKRFQSQLEAEAQQVRDWQAEQRKLQDEGRRVFEATRTPAEQLATEIERLNRLLAAGTINWDTYARAQFAAQEQFDQTNAKVEKQAEGVNDVSKQLGMSFSSAFEDAIVNGGKFSDILKGLEQDILRIATRKLVTEPLGNALAGVFSSAGASAGGWLSGLFAGMFADGGYIPPGRWGITGERGPEAVFGGRSGVTVQPNTGAGAMKVEQHFHVSGNADRRTQSQLFAAAARGVREGQMRGTA